MTEEHSHHGEHAHHEHKKEGFSLSAPLAILIAGVLIAGAVLYTKGTPALAPAADNGVVAGKDAGFSPDDIVAMLAQATGGNYVLGNPNAPVTIVEFGDFECPFCAQFHTQARREIISKYVDSGQVKMVWRHFPLNQIHQFAQISSEAAECAGDQGKFWEMHDMIYENQQVLSESALITFGQNLGLNTGAFQSCLDSGKYEQKVTDDLNLGLAVGVSGTPTFYINGTQVVGALPFSQIEPYIQQALQ